MAGSASPKVVRSYRLVFRRRWRIFRLQGWRIPLPGGVELRALGYWLACLLGLAAAAELPLLGAAISVLPPSLRLAVLPLLGAWALSRTELDGRAPHRALAALALWWLRPRCVGAGRRCAPSGASAPPPGAIVCGPDFFGPRYPKGRLLGPARVLLRYPVRVSPLGGGRGSARERAARARRLRLGAVSRAPLRRGAVLEVAAGREAIFD